MKKIKIDFKKIDIKRAFLTLFIAFLACYVLSDLAGKTVNSIRLQGYTMAVKEMIKQAENEECFPFNIFSGEKNVELINVDCLQQNTGMEGMIVGEE